MFIRRARKKAALEVEDYDEAIAWAAQTALAESFLEAARTYEGDVTALHLRAMNMLFEGLKEKGALIIVPSTAVETMALGGIAGITSLSQITPTQVTGDRKKAESEEG